MAKYSLSRRVRIGLIVRIGRWHLLPSLLLLLLMLSRVLYSHIGWSLQLLLLRVLLLIWSVHAHVGLHLSRTSKLRALRRRRHVSSLWWRHACIRCRRHLSWIAILWSGHVISACEWCLWVDFCTLVIVRRWVSSSSLSSEK